MEEQKGMTIGNARVIIAMSSPLIQTLRSQGYSKLDAVTTAYVIQRKPQMEELSVSPDGTIRLSEAARARLDTLRVYTDQDGAVYIVDGDIGEVEGYECLGKPGADSYAIAVCAELKMDSNKLYSSR